MGTQNEPRSHVYARIAEFVSTTCDVDVTADEVRDYLDGKTLDHHSETVRLEIVFEAEGYKMQRRIKPRD